MKLVSRKQRREQVRKGLRAEWLRRTYPLVRSMEERAAKIASLITVENIVTAAHHLTYEGTNSNEKTTRRTLAAPLASLLDNRQSEAGSQGS